MKSKHKILLLPLLSIILVATKCPGTVDQSVLAKIMFDISQIDEDGLRRGEAAVDYEFCIPADEDKLRDIRLLAPDVHVLPASKGRVGCREGQWLMIQSTRQKGWKEVLYSIAGKPYVEKIIETYYE